MRLIEIPEWDTLNLIEAIWLFAGLMAFVFAALRVRPVLGDYRVANEMHEPDLHVIARGYLRREFIRLAQAACIIGIGVYSGLQPSVLPGPARISLVGLIITAALITISFLVALQSYLDWRDREEVKSILRSRT